MNERRAHPRYPTHEFGVLHELVDGVEIREQVVYVMNVSAFGLGIQIDRPIAVGTAVKVFATDYAFIGTIVYCRKDSDGFAAGLALRCDTDQANRLLVDAQRRNSEAQRHSLRPKLMSE